MNKEQLREVIRNAVLKKIAESKSITDPEYGYTMPDDEGNVDKENPRYQLIGYGNMPKSNWKTKILRDIDGLKKLIEQENWAGAAHVINKSSVLYNSINMMKEISDKESDDEESNLNELSKDQIDATFFGKKGEESTKEPDDTDPQISPAIQKQIAEKQKKLNAAMARVREIDGTKSKLQEPVRKKEQDLDRQSAKLKKIIGTLTQELEKLKKKNNG